MAHTRSFKTNKQVLRVYGIYWDVRFDRQLWSRIAYSISWNDKEYWRMYVKFFPSVHGDCRINYWVEPRQHGGKLNDVAAPMTWALGNSVSKHLPFVGLMTSKGCSKAEPTEKHIMEFHDEADDRPDLPSRYSNFKDEHFPSFCRQVPALYKIELFRTYGQVSVPVAIWPPSTFDCSLWTINLFQLPRMLKNECGIQSHKIRSRRSETSKMRRAANNTWEAARDKYHKRDRNITFEYATSAP